MNDEEAIPVHFGAGASDTYQISMESNGHFGTLILEDLFAGKHQDLGSGLPYVFDAHPSDPSDRFLLRTGGDDATNVDD